MFSRPDPLLLVMSQNVDTSPREDRVSPIDLLRFRPRESEEQAGSTPDSTEPDSTSPRSEPPRLFLSPGGSSLHQVERGAVVWVAIEHEEEQYVLSALVRWRGWNQTRTQVGFGVEFEPHCQIVAQGLAFGLDQDGILFIPAHSDGFDELC